MDVERARRTRELFDAARELPEDLRHDYLTRECQDDPELEQLVWELLCRDEPTGETLGRLLIEAAPRRCGPEVGDLIGSYRVVHPIDAGGMGEVVLATRADGAFEQEVAIKVLPRRAASPEAQHHFYAERQILAGLDHPNICRLFDGGTTEAGDLFLVMEHVTGDPITDFCDRRRLSVRERLGLFLRLCEAVSYAHQRLVVHRDLKPSNVLVTEQGQPKLLDFGIAKVLATGGGDLVETGRSGPLTPTYASPEQLAGEPVSAATDVYALGVLLYQLLAGAPPFDWGGLSAGEILSRLEREEIVPLSVAANDASVAETRSTTVRRLVRDLSGDLDSIAAKTLRRRSADRYSSVEQLASDVRSHLEDQPVDARSGGYAYRVGKLARRHRLPIGIATALAALVVALVTLSIVQAVRVARERDLAFAAGEHAREERARAEAVTDFLVGMFQLGAVSEVEDLTPRQIVDRGAERLAELGDQPQLHAALAHALGAVYGGLGSYDQATRLLQAALEERRESLGEDHLDVAATLDKLARIHALGGRPEAAVTAARGALDIRRGQLGPRHRLVADSHDELGNALTAAGEFESAEKEYRQSLDLRRRLLGDRHPEVAETMANLAGWMVTSRSDFLDAAPLFRQALEIVGPTHPWRTNIRHNLAVTLSYLGEYGDATRLFEEIVEEDRRTLGPEHPELARSLRHLAIARAGLGDLDVAEDLLREAVAMRRRLLGFDHPELASALVTLGGVLLDRGSSAEAEDLLKEALEIRRRRFGEEHPDVAESLRWLGVLQLRRGDEAAAETLLRRARDIEEASLGPRHHSSEATLIELAELLVRTGRHGEAEDVARQVLESARGRYPEGDWRIAAAESHLGAALAGRGDLDAAEPLLISSHEALQSFRRGQSRRGELARQRLVDLYRARREPDRARRYEVRRTRKTLEPTG